MVWFIVIYALWSIVGALWIISRCERAMSAWGWALAMIVCAPLATLFYYLTTVPRAEYLPAEHRASYSRLQNVVANGCGSALTLHNKVQALHNGDATFSALMRDVQRAREEINIEYYILECDRVGRALLQLLMRRARAGVKVRIIYDGVGSWRLGRKERERIKGSGIEIRAYAPLRPPFLTRAAHRRNHRKVVVIDNRIAYLGGINIAGRYLHGGKLGFWRDEHLRVEGAAAQQLRSLFAEDWRAVGGEIQGVAMLASSVMSVCPMQILWVQEGFSRMTLLHAMMEAVASARHNIRITTPYFLPSEELLSTIIVAVRGGVKVEILIPRVSDVRIVGLASERYIARSIEAGAEVYGYGAGFMHSKTIVIDESVVVVGSANIDGRSLYYNMEASAIIYNRRVAREYISRFETDVALSERVTQERFTHRSAAQLLTQGLSRLLAPLL